MFAVGGTRIIHTHMSLNMYNNSAARRHETRRVRDELTEYRRLLDNEERTVKESIEAADKDGLLSNTSSYQ